MTAPDAPQGAHYHGSAQRHDHHHDDTDHLGSGGHPAAPIRLPGATIPAAPGALSMATTTGPNTHMVMNGTSTATIGVGSPS